MSQREALNRFEWLVVWFAASALWTVAVAWIAFQVQQEGIAPAVLFPLAVGAALAAGGLAILHWTRAAGRGSALAAAVVWGLLVVVGQDYIGHRHHLRSFDDAVASHDSPLAAAMAQEDGLRPTFAEYLAGRVRARPVWWGLDVLLTGAGAVLVTALGARRLDSMTRMATGIAES
jgi:hypothetical protein